MSVNLDFGWFFKGKELDQVIKGFEESGIVKEKKSSVTFSALDISDEKSLNDTVDAIYNEYKGTLGSWFEKHKKSAIKSTLIEAKTQYIAEAATYLHFAFLNPENDLNKLNELDIKNRIQHVGNHVKKLYDSIQKLSGSELDIIKKGQNRHILFDIFYTQSRAVKNECKDQSGLASHGVMRLGVFFNKHSSKFSSVARHINKEFMKIRLEQQ